MKRISILVTLILLIIVSGCAQKKDYVVTIKTRYGNMVAILYDETPLHKANFIKLAKEHYYDSTLFHRVIQGFMIQGGDPDSKKAVRGQRLGLGGPGYTVNAEFNPKFFHERGALSAARLSDDRNPSKASSGSQFYVVQGTKMTEAELKTDLEKMYAVLGQFFQNPANQGAYDSLMTPLRAQDTKLLQERMVQLKPRVEKELNISLSKDISPERMKVYTTVGGTPALDGGYTVFGKVIQGLDVLDKIAAVTKDDGDRPVEDIRMTVTVEELPVKKIEKLYGYHYPEKK